MAIKKVKGYWSLGIWLGNQFIVVAAYANYWQAAKALLNTTA
jgi:hypothetical protein